MTVGPLALCTNTALRSRRVDVVVGVVCGDHVINCCRCLLCTKSLAVLLGRIAEIAAYCCRLSSVVCLPVCLCVCVGHVRGLCENGWTDWYGVWGRNQGTTYWIGVQIPEGKGQFWGLSGLFKSIGTLVLSSLQKGSFNRPVKRKGRVRKQGIRLQSITNRKKPALARVQNPLWHCFLCLVILTFDPKINEFPGLTVEHFCVEFGDPSFRGFFKISCVYTDRQTDRQTPVKAEPPDYRRRGW